MESTVEQQPHNSFPSESTVEQQPHNKSFPSPEISVETAHSISFSPEEPPFKRKCRRTNDVSSLPPVGPRIFASHTPHQAYPPLWESGYTNSPGPPFNCDFLAPGAMPMPPLPKWPGSDITDDDNGSVYSRFSNPDFSISVSITRLHFELNSFIFLTYRD